MPELPDITVYIEALERVVGGSVLRELRVLDPFVLRTVSPATAEFAGREVTAMRRIGKRIVLSFAGDLHAVIHLMIAGRLRWAPGRDIQRKRSDLVTFRFDSGSLSLTETGSKRRASVHLESGAERLERHDPGGLEVLEARFDRFRDAIARERHTLKRTLTDPRILSGIGNAYSDEILHRARLSPFKLSDTLSEAEAVRLFDATVAVLEEWTDRLRTLNGDGFPSKVTAFREGMAVHGRFGRACPECGAPVQRIRYADREANYCPGCQTGGRILADRSLSRLLKADWPKTLEDLERFQGEKRSNV